MRDIKFRAWVEMTIFTGMIDVNEILFDREVLCGFSKTHGEVATVLPSVKLMQYTGLKDKNGVEIYEGDIINRKYHHGVLSWEAEFIGEVKFLEGAWLIDSGADAMSLWSETEENEVIGNIYENPELLEV